MTNPDYTHLLIVADRSGSMSSIARDMNGGLQTFLDEQDKLPGELIVDLVTFDDKIDIADSLFVKDIQHPIIRPRGGTALLDAIGRGVGNLGERLSKRAEEHRPGKVIVMVVTDGMDNRSIEFTAPVLKKVIDTQTNEFGWEFLFLGANIDSFSVAGELGLRKGSTINYDATSDGTQSVLRSASAYVGATRGGTQAAFSDEDRAAAQQS